MRPWLRRRLASNVTVHLTTGDTVAGFLEETGRDGIILRAARYLDTDVQVTMAGELFIPKDKITMVQLGDVA